MPGPRRQANGLPWGVRHIMRPAPCGSFQACHRGLSVSRIWNCEARPLCPAGRCNLRAAIRLGKESRGCVLPAGCALRGGFTLHRRACLSCRTGTLTRQTSARLWRTHAARRLRQAQRDEEDKLRPENRPSRSIKAFPGRERAPVITLRPGRRHASACIPFGFTRITCPAALMTAFQPWQPDVSGSLRSMLRHPPRQSRRLA